MESILARRICGMHLKQIRKYCQSWRQFTVLCSHPQKSLSVVHKRSYKNTVNEKPFKGKQEPFIYKRKISDEEIMEEELRLSKLSEEERSKRFGNQSGPKLAVIWATAIGFLVAYYFLKERLKKQQMAELKQTMKTEETVLIGGDWELTNQDGKKVTNKDYEGSWVLIYFGFTHCPDICPDELEKIVEVMEILDRNPKIPNVKALFVTVDPKRDSPEALKAYLAEFSDKIVGLTGNDVELKKILRAFKVYYSMGPKDEDGDYIVDHSIITYLMNPDGKYESHFARSKTNIDVANAVENKMITWSRKS